MNFDRELLKCKTPEDVDTVFQQHQIMEPKERTEILRKLMNVRAVYITGDESDSDTYDDDVTVFLEGWWNDPPIVVEDF